MSAPINHRSFVAVEDDFSLCTVLWRGGMIDRFAKCEQDILECLQVARDCGFSLHGDAFAEAAMKRHRALIAFLEAEGFTGRSKHSMRLLRELAEYAELRTGLAHGRIRKQFGKVLLEWKRCRGEARQHSLSFDLTETYADLLKLDKLQRDLRSELGQIRKAVSTRPL